MKRKNLTAVVLVLLVLLGAPAVAAIVSLASMAGAESRPGGDLATDITPVILIWGALGVVAIGVMAVLRVVYRRQAQRHVPPRRYGVVDLNGHRR